MRRVLGLMSLATWLCAYGGGFAQDEAEEDAPAAEEASEPAAAAGTDDAPAPEQTDEPAAASGKTPEWFVGAYLDGVIVPSFMLNLFLAESPSVFNASFGATV